MTSYEIVRKQIDGYIEGLKEPKSEWGRGYLDACKILAKSWQNPGKTHGRS